MIKQLIIAVLFLPILTNAQINVRDLGARGNGSADDSYIIQKAIDSAIKSGKSVIIPKGRYKIEKPLVVSNWDGKDYKAVFIKIIGESTMWDMGDMSVIQASFKDAPALSIQKGKGCIISGIFFQGAYQVPKISLSDLYRSTLEEYGDRTCRDSRYSPYCAIAIDPFSSTLPPDGGYPSLKKFYRGSGSRGGSTGIRIEDCSFDKFTIGAITSPNGSTQNAELITFQNIRIGSCKIGIAGCQDQEKLNRVINLGAWGTTHTVFAFNKYGAARPGHWTIDGVNIAGEVVQIVYRVSHGWFPLFMKNIYAESVLRIGHWQSAVGDCLSEFVIDFRYPEDIGFLPDNHLSGGGVALKNGSLRYYGKNYPIILLGSERDYSVQDVEVSTTLGVKPAFLSTRVQNAIKNKESIIIQDVTVNKQGNSVEIQRPHPKAIVGKMVVFLNASNSNFVGTGVIESISKSGFKIKWASPIVTDKARYRISIID
ncbi:glycosyl hydrolase family 28-related protein [Flavihumibacter sp. ZG627]|uniref:glycosyl hydrolase family 28-related protein n=1 Tax=Flavihumibacter sp. ZG627 TaxID=1463156 RepID=UPI00057D3056|nr:glycosyl hydrolase family 28-related protein [Flavihumibacter sp. ZG627]KIC92256.1 hypothetical protein HY58_01500 [Flavihumibacter sp. ZG627]